jgi:diguanylate cyclase (GGDEF)-like protein/PAS domain S-box-containing protein
LDGEGLFVPFGSGFMFPLKSEDGRLEGFAKIMRDNTERRLAEESLERANQELQRRIAEETARRSAETSLTHALADFQMLMDSMTDCAIVLLDKNGGVVDWNRGSENILQYRRDEVMGRNLDFIHTPEDLERQSWQDELQCARLKGRSVEDKWLVRKNGERFFSSGILQPMLDEAGQLRGFAKIMRDITKRKLAEEEANYLANHDLLTGLPNRASFSTRLHHELARAKRYEKTFAVQLLDLNRFKFINDTLGHQAGDLLLQQVATRLSSCVRETDMVARVGGDEFVVIQTDLRTVGEAGLLAKKIIKELSQPFKLEDSEVWK